MTEVIQDNDPGDGETSRFEELIAQFLDANQQFSEAAKAVLGEMTEDDLEMFGIAKNVASYMLGQILNVSSPIEDEETARFTGSAVIKASETLWETAQLIRPEVPCSVTYDSEYLDGFVEQVLSDDEITRIEAIDQLGGSYFEAVDTLIDMFAGSQKVLEIEDKFELSQERKEMLINVGSFSLATFIGVSAALYIDRKLRK